MPIYKGAVEVTSGNLHKGSTEIQEGYKASDAFYVNSTVISFIDYPGITPNPKTFSGSPGDTISPAATVSWSVSAPSGQAYQSTPTISGVSSPFVSSVSSNGSGFGSTNSTVATFSVNKPGTYPSNAISSDYGNVTTSAPTSTITSASLNITTANFNGGGGSGFGSTVTGSISGNSIIANGSGPSGTGCAAGAYGFQEWSISGVPNASPSPFQGVTSKSVPGIPASASGNTYSGTVQSVGQLTWAAWLTFTQDQTIAGCPATGYTCYDSSATWTGSGGGNLGWSLATPSVSACYIQFSYHVICNNSSADPKTLVTYFSSTGSYGGACNVTYTL
jgi:hypothetical protein